MISRYQLALALLMHTMLVDSSRLGLASHLRESRICFTFFCSTFRYRLSIFNLRVFLINGLAGLSRSKRSLDLDGSLCLLCYFFFNLFIFTLNSFTLGSSFWLCPYNYLNVFRLDANVDLIKVFNLPRREVSWKAFCTTLLLKKCMRSWYLWQLSENIHVFNCFTCPFKLRRHSFSIDIISEPIFCLL